MPSNPKAADFNLDQLLAEAYVAGARAALQARDVVTVAFVRALESWAKYCPHLPPPTMEETLASEAQRQAVIRDLKAAFSGVKS